MTRGRLGQAKTFSLFFLRIFFAEYKPSHYSAERKKETVTAEERKRKRVHAKLNWIREAKKLQRFSHDIDRSRRACRSNFDFPPIAVSLSHKKTISAETESTHIITLTPGCICIFTPYSGPITLNWPGKLRANLNTLRCRHFELFFHGYWHFWAARKMI